MITQQQGEESVDERKIQRCLALPVKARTTCEEARGTIRRDSRGSVVRPCDESRATH